MSQNSPGQILYRPSVLKACCCTYSGLFCNSDTSLQNLVRKGRSAPFASLTRSQSLRDVAQLRFVRMRQSEGQMPVLHARPLDWSDCTGDIGGSRSIFGGSTASSRTIGGEEVSAERYMRRRLLASKTSAREPIASATAKTTRGCGSLTTCATISMTCSSLSPTTYQTISIL